MAELFISHIHEKRGQADALVYLLRDRLRVDSFSASNIWQLRGGEQWLDRIRSELRTCRVMLSLLSQHSVKQPWINFEAGAAWVTGKPAIPCCHGGMKKGGLPQPFATLHAVDMPDNLYPLLIAVSHHLRPGAPSPPPWPADQLEKAVKEAFSGKPFHPPPGLPLPQLHE